MHRRKDVIVLKRFKSVVNMSQNNNQNRVPELRSNVINILLLSMFIFACRGLKFRPFDRFLITPILVDTSFIGLRQYEP